MRVPSITQTAGYAAPTHSNSFLNEQFYAGLQTPEELNKNNGNIALTNQHLNYESTSEFVSSADEFVKRALCSLPTYEAESNFEFQRTFNDNENENFNTNIKQSQAENIKTQEEPSQYNTYRSFKDTFNINKPFYEECAKNLNTLHTQQLEDDYDPILVINTTYKKEANIHSSTYDVQSIEISATKGEELKEEPIINKTRITESLELYTNNRLDVEESFNDNDYDDQTMIDLCQHQENEKLNEILDRAYLTSPTTSSVSDNTPKRTFSYFPRGIINPNYPGFQHLAHTLSEHFITRTSQSDSYDSDMSEYEMELSDDSLEDISEEAKEQFNTKLNKYNNNFDKQDFRAITFKNMHPNDLLNTEMHIAQNNVYEDYVNYSNNSDDNCNIDIRDLPISLKTTLTLLEPVDCIRTSCETPEPSEANEYINERKTKYVRTPPDIILKDDCLHVTEKFLKKENRPDLLYGVSPHHVSTKLKAQQCQVQEPLMAINQPIAVLELPTKDEMSLGVTPVDIIGDFGQEVEREFGLLVSGYRRLMDGSMEGNKNEGNIKNECISKHAEHLIDAKLSMANDEIDTDKYLAALKRYDDDDFKELENTFENEKIEMKENPTSYDFTEDNNAVDWCLSAGVDEKIPKQEKQNKVIEPDQNQNGNHITSTIHEMNTEGSNKIIDTDFRKPKYQKASYDERQLPPVAIEYKRCQQSQRKVRNSTIDKNIKTLKKPSITNRLLHGKRNVFKSEQGNNTNRTREEAEIDQYQQLINDKELILSNSRYTKLSSWAQYLKNSVKDRKAQNSIELISPSALELFDAYKVGGDVDRETLQKHLKMAKEIEKKRRSDREEIRRRLAMGDEDNANNTTERRLQKPGPQSTLNNGLYISRLNDGSSDTESHSSDSETCPKLSNSRQHSSLGSITSSINDHNTNHPYHGRPLSINCTKKQFQQEQSQQLEQQNEKERQLKQQKKQEQNDLLPITDEDKECDFFTKQARLQIEARLALAQAKEMAHMHMEFERQNHRVSPITGIIRESLEQIGVQMTMDKRRVSRQLLTDMNIAQLQILVNSMHTHIEDLNESLVKFLMERDDLHFGQDAMLSDIEELTRFIGTQEHLTHQHKRTTKCNRSK